jgi:hypothetical protein
VERRACRAEGANGERRPKDLSVDSAQVEPEVAPPPRRGNVQPRLATEDAVRTARVDVRVGADAERPDAGRRVAGGDAASRQRGERGTHGDEPCASAKRATPASGSHGGDECIDAGPTSPTPRSSDAAKQGPAPRGFEAKGR